MFKHIFLVSIIVSIGFLISLATLSVTKVGAVNVLSNVCSNSGASSSTVCVDNSTGSNDNPIYGPNGILTKIIYIVSWVVGIVSIVMIIVSGFRLVISGGDSNGVSSARTAIIYSLVGLAIASSAQALVIFVLNKA